MPEIKVLAIPDLLLEPREWFVGGVWPKLGIYDPHFRGLKWRLVFIDVDIVVLRDLDAFFDVPGRTGVGQGFTVAEELGSAPIAFDTRIVRRLAEKFRAGKSAILGRYRTEQTFIGAELGDVGFWP